MSLLHKQLTYEIRRCIFDVYNELEPGLDEESYHLALAYRLSKSKLSFLSKPTSFLECRGKNIHKFIPDLIVEDKVILELKSTKSDFVSANYIQIFSYLKHWQKDLGPLVNFGSLKAKIERVPFYKKKLVLEEDYSEINDFIQSTDRRYFELVRKSILNILEIHGFGYDYSIYKLLFLEELSYQNAPFIPSIILPIKFDGQHLKNSELKVPLIANKILCGITAGQSDLTLQYKAMKNYLNIINVPIGIIANFQKDKLEIIGISR